VGITTERELQMITDNTEVELEKDLGKEIYMDRQTQFENQIIETAKKFGWSKRKARRALESNGRKVYRKFKKLAAKNKPKIDLSLPTSTEVVEEPI
jgi:DNA-binding NtrC family response regulator